MKNFNKFIVVILTIVTVGYFVVPQTVGATSFEKDDILVTPMYLPVKEAPVGGSSSKYYFNDYVHVTGGKYTNRPSQTRIWQVVYSNGNKYEGWVDWTGKYKTIGFGVNTYQYTGVLNKVP